MPQPPTQTDALPRGSSAGATLPCLVQSGFRAPGLPAPCTWQPRSRLLTFGLPEAPEATPGRRRLTQTLTQPPATMAAAGTAAFTLSMILTSLIRATCSAHGETRVEMTHEALPPTRVLWAGLHRRMDAMRVLELLKVGRAS